MLTVFGVQAVSSVETFNDFAVSVVLVGCSLLCGLFSSDLSLLLPFVIFVCCSDFRSFVASLLSHHFFSVSCVFWLFGYVQRFLSYQATQGFQGLHVFVQAFLCVPNFFGHSQVVQTSQDHREISLREVYPSGERYTSRRKHSNAVSQVCIGFS